MTFNTPISELNIAKYMIELKIALKELYLNIMDSKGLAVLISTIIMCFLYGDMFAPVLSGAILYLMILLRELLTHKIENDKLKSIDLHYFEHAKNNLEDPLDGYVDMCINEYMILYRGYKDHTFIKKDEEALMRKEILDIMASNMSPLMKAKFELYYGKGRVENLLARKCFIRVSLYVAENNKVLYEESEPRKMKDIDQMFKDVLMNSASLSA